ncbi:MAG: cell division ATP-binding protein FtsE [Rhodovibrionaceae bacterium]
MIRFEQVSLRYDTGPEVLRDLDFHLEPGSFHFLLGPSGAGKSSLLKMMSLGQRPSSGRLSLFGRDVSRLDRKERALLRRRIGVVFQDFRLIEHLTTVENVALPLRVAGQREDKVREHVSELLSWVGLADHLNALPATLSGGQQQRVAIARAVISRPSLLLADEPTGNVDDRIAMRLLYLFEELHRNGTTVVIATHNEMLANRFDQPVVRLSDHSAEIEDDSGDGETAGPPPRRELAATRGDG